MVLVNKWKSVRFQSLQNKRLFQKFNCLTKHCLWILSTRSLKRHIFHMVLKGTIPIVILLLLLFWQTNRVWFNKFTYIKSVVSAVINKYSTISSYLAVPKGLIENQRRFYVIFTWNRVVKVCQRINESLPSYVSSRSWKSIRRTK